MIESTVVALRLRDRAAIGQAPRRWFRRRRSSRPSTGSSLPATAGSSSTLARRAGGTARAAARRGVGRLHGRRGCTSSPRRRRGGDRRSEAGVRALSGERAVALRRGLASGSRLARYRQTRRLRGPADASVFFSAFVGFAETPV